MPGFSHYCPEKQGYSKVNLMDYLFWFCRNLILREFFHEDTRTDTDSNNIVYNKMQERTNISKQIKNC